MINEIRRAFKARAEERIRNIEQQLGSGRAGDYAQYQAFVNRIAGIRESLDLLDDAAKAYNEGDDDDGDEIE